MTVVLESVSDVLISKGIEEKICVNVAAEIASLFKAKVHCKYEESIRLLETDVVKQAIKEAVDKDNTGPN